MMLIWHDAAWNDYLYWQTQDKKTVQRINQLIKDIERNGFEGIGKPEPLKGDLAGFWSRRIDEKNRLVSRVEGDDCLVAQCRGHYE
jgi:toxin YoeB